MKTRTTLFLAALTLGGVVLEWRAHANCVPGTSQADFTMAELLPCGQLRTEDIAAIRLDFEMEDDDWNSRGVNTPCDVTTELSKHVSSGLLLTNGVNFTRDSTPGAVQSFHATGFPDGDYSQLVAADEINDWHDDFLTQVVDNLGPGVNAQMNLNPVSENQLQLSCRMYDTGVGGGLADPAVRAQVIAHEAQHGWEEEHGAQFSTSCGHQLCPPPMGQPPHLSTLSCIGTAECDTFFPHPLSAIGTMVGQTHHPFQTMVEFGCDLADTPADFVPLIVRELSNASSAFLANTDIINGPMPPCGGFTFGVQYQTCSNPANQCGLTTTCPAGQLCSPQSGCCEDVPSNLHPFVIAGAFQTQLGPDFCTTVSGFLPNEQVNITYSGFPVNPTTTTIINRGPHTVDNTGSLHFFDTMFDQSHVFCGPHPQGDPLDFAKTTVLVTGLTSMLQVSDTIPNGFICGTTPSGVSTGNCP
jgi:hypothetical protein